MATSKRTMRRLGLILVSVFALAQPAWALFGNTELSNQVHALQQRLDTMDERLGKLEAALQRNQQLLHLLKEVEAVKEEVARLRGEAEVQTHELDTLGKRQNDLYADLDQRLSELTKPGPPVPAPVVPPSPETTSPAGQAAPPAAAASSADAALESRSYEAALTLFREGNYAGAIAGFSAFLRTYPASPLAPNAQYWVGYSYYALKDYKTALAQQQKLVNGYPDSAKIPDALLNIAANQVALDDIASARKTLEQLVAKHPGSQAATLAARRLAALK